VFYLRYVRSELLRRRSRTIVTVLGLALGVALVVIGSLTRQLAMRDGRVLTQDGTPEPQAQPVA
jgi:hypothetical protein